MKQEIVLQTELEKLKNAPQYMDFLCKLVRQKMGTHKDEVKAFIYEAMTWYHLEELKVYENLLILKMEYHLLYGELNEAIQCGEAFIEEAKEQLNGLERIEIYVRLLKAYMEKGLFEEALTKYKLMETFKEEHHAVYRLRSLTLAELYLRMEAYEKAKGCLDYVETMREWLSEEDLLRYEMLLLEYYLVKDVEKAVGYSQKAYARVCQFDKEEKLYDLGELLTLRAMLNRKRKLKMQPEKDFESAAQINQQFKLSHMRTLIQWGEYLLEEEKYGDAKEKAKRAIELAKGVASSYYIEKSYKLLQEIYKTTQEWEEAYKTLQEMNEVVHKFGQEKIETRENHQRKHQAMDKEQVAHQLDAQTNRAQEKNLYQQEYKQIQKVAQLGERLTKPISMEELPQLIQEEIANLVALDMVGIAIWQKNESTYKLYELQSDWLAEKNTLVKYTNRLADYCIQYQTNIVVNDGNFEAYTLKQIINSDTDIKLQSMIVMTLKSDNKVMGALTIGNYKAGVYSQKDVEIVKIIASYLSLALKNSHLDDQIQYLAEHDHLTGLLSRKMALKKGERLFKENHKKHKQTAVIILDMDLFKRLNVKYGNALGDEVLSKVGQIIKSNIRPEDYVGRYGGEEFIVILNDLSLKGVVKIVEQIKKAVDDISFETKKEKNIKVTLSGGIYLCNEYTLNFDDAIQFADHALYRAKLLGRNRIINYSLNEGK